MLQCSRCGRIYCSYGYRAGKPVCLFCLDIEADAEELDKFPEAQDIKPGFILKHKASDTLVRCRSMTSRTCLKGKRNYYYCDHEGSVCWYKDEDIRLITEDESNAAMGWMIGNKVAEYLDTDDCCQMEEEEKIDMPQNMPKAIDLFSGAGGFTLGIAASFDVVGHVEYEKHAQKTYELNKVRSGFPNSELIGEDITKITDEQIKAFNEKKHANNIQLIIGSPPCQGFSHFGRRDPKDPRNSLFIHFVRFVRLIKPPLFIMENVPGLRSMKTVKGEQCLDIILQSFRNEGYKVDYGMLNAANYGVPQHRLRIIIQGVREDLNKLPRFPLPTHYGEGEGKLKTKKESTKELVSVERMQTTLEGYG